MLPEIQVTGVPFFSSLSPEIPEMKNRKTTYFLLPLALLVWGLIAYKIIAHLNSTDSGMPQTTTKTAGDGDIAPRDTFSLLLNYRDPFLGTDNTAETNTDNIVAADPGDFFSSSPEQQQPEPQYWPSITYHGIILNKKTGNRITLVKIDNKEQLLAEGQEITGVRLIKAFSDSGIFKFQKEIKTIKK